MSESASVTVCACPSSRLSVMVCMHLFCRKVLMLVAVRKVMEKIFTRHELELLDDLMPETVKKKKLEEEEDNESDSDSDDEDGQVRQYPDLNRFLSYVPIFQVHTISYLTHNS